MKNIILFSCTFLLPLILYGQQIEPNEMLRGSWLLTLEHDDIGCARTQMTFENDHSTFNAHSRTDADKDILGKTTSVMARLFNKNMKKGSLLQIRNGKFHIENDTLKLSGIFTSAMGNYYFTGFVLNNYLTAKLTNKNGTIRGTIKGEKKAFPFPLENYAALFDASMALTENKIYNKEIIKSKKWKSFVKNMEKVTPKIQDDLEMVFTFFYYARKLPLSHYALMKLPKDKKNEESFSLLNHVSLEEKSPQTGYLKINSFGGSSQEMDSIFQCIIQKNYQNLIVDLRNNSGGSIEAGMAFVTSLVDTSFYGGVFLTQKWFNQHPNPPKVEDYASFPFFSEANFDLIIEGIHHTNVLCLKIIPKEQVYSGKLYLLTNTNTASTCEPIVYGLKQLNRAIIIGERTAGKMLNGEFFELEKDFKMVIPTADYYTSDGFRIDQKGVKPTIRVKQNEALDYVVNCLIK